MFSMRQRVRERAERSSRTWRCMSGLLSEVSPSVGRSGDGDLGGRVTCRRWVADDEGFSRDFPKIFSIF